MCGVGTRPGAVQFTASLLPLHPHPPLTNPPPLTNQRNRVGKPLPACLSLLFDVFRTCVLQRCLHHSRTANLLAAPTSTAATPAHTHAQLTAPRSCPPTTGYIPPHLRGRGGAESSSPQGKGPGTHSPAPRDSARGTAKAAASAPASKDGGFDRAAAFKGAVESTPDSGYS